MGTESPISSAAMTVHERLGRGQFLITDARLRFEPNRLDRHRDGVQLHHFHQPGS